MTASVLYLDHHHTNGENTMKKTIATLLATVALRLGGLVTPAHLEATRGRREAGATAVEYALLVATCAMAVALSWEALETAIEAAYNAARVNVGSVPDS